MTTQALVGTWKKCVLTALVVCLALALPVMAFTAQITTSQKQYSVGEGMVVLGSGFTPQVTITLSVERPDHLIDIVPGVVTDTSGVFTATYTPPLEPGRYKFTATDGANSANTATTGADNIGYNKGVYKKANNSYAGGAGTWTTGDAGSNYLEGQWAFYQYEITGLGATPVSTDVTYNHFQSNTSAIFIDAFANFRACVDCIDSSNTSGPSKGMLADGIFAPPSGSAAWVDAHTAITLVNHPFDVTNTCTVAGDPLNTPSAAHCFHVDGAALYALLGGAGTFGTGTHTISIYYAAHLAATRTWSQGFEALLGCPGDPNYVIASGPPPNGQGAEFIPLNTVFGTDAYNPLDSGTTSTPCDVDTGDWTSAAFFGIGSATGSSRHFSLANQSSGSQGGIDLPIPSVPAPTGTITIVKVTNPAVAAGVSFSYTTTGTGLSSFTLDTDPATATVLSTKSFVALTGGVTYTVTEGAEPTGWTFTSLNCVNTTGTSVLGTSGTTATITLAGTANAHVTCTYTNTAQGHIIVDKVTNPSGDPQSFSFTAGGTGYSSFSLTDAAAPNDQTLVAGGPYTISEGATTGWTLTDRTCVETIAGAGGSTFPGTGTSQPVSITLAAGATITCTYTNTKQTQLRIKKTTVPSGDPTVFTFTPSGGWNTNNTAFTRTDAQAAFPSGFLAPGTYGAAETVPTGWALTGTACVLTGTATPHAFTTPTNGVSVVLASGEDVTCTFTDTKPDAKITLSPLTATNSVGSPHTITATVQQNAGSGFVAAPDGTLVTFSLLNNTAGAAFTTGPPFTCTTSGGTCSITINSSTPGSVDIHATTTFSVLGVSLTRASGDGLSGDSVNANKLYVAGGIIVRKTTVGGFGAFSFAATGSGIAGTINLTTSSGNNPNGVTFSNLAVGVAGGSRTITENGPSAAWKFDSVTCTGAVASSVSTSGQVATITTLAAGETITCTFVNDLLPTLQITKTVQGTGTATFGYHVTGDNTITTTITPPAAPSSANAFTPPQIINPSTVISAGNTISEDTPLPAGWTLTDASCTGASGGVVSGPLDTNGVPTFLTFKAGFGDNVVCTYVNNNAQATRTQGFWATHTTLSNNIWNGTNLPAGATGVIGSGDEVFSGGACGAGFTITALPTPGENILMGGFWSGISQKSGKGGKRSSIDQARMQMMQQYLAAVLNFHMFGSIGETILANARAAYCGTNQSAIQGFVGTLGNLNQLGDNLGTTPGGSATSQTSKSQADIDAWDTPTNPVD